MVHVTKDECTGCGMCVEACPQEAVGLNNKVAVVIEASCIECGTCVDLCPDGAIQFPSAQAA